MHENVLVMHRFRMIYYGLHATLVNVYTKNVLYNCQVGFSPGIFHGIPPESDVKLLCATPWKIQCANTINDDFCSGCQNVSDHQQFFSELLSPGRPHYTKQLIQHKRSAQQED